MLKKKRGRPFGSTIKNPKSYKLSIRLTVKELKYLNLKVRINKSKDASEYVRNKIFDGRKIT